MNSKASAVMGECSSTKCQPCICGWLRGCESSYGPKPGAVASLRGYSKIEGSSGNSEEARGNNVNIKSL